MNDEKIKQNPLYLRGYQNAAEGKPSQAEYLAGDALIKYEAGEKAYFDNKKLTANGDDNEQCK